MAYANGQWNYEDASVAPRVTNLMSSDNPLIKQAQQQGLEAGNRRGLLNSSIAVGAAQGEAYKAALPIAQTDASNIQQANLAKQDQTATADRQSADIAAQMDRLRTQAGFTSSLQGQGDAAAMERLRASGDISGAQQATALAAQAEQQRVAGEQQIAGIRTSGEVQGGLNAQQAEAEMSRLQASLANANDQQRAAITAQMDQLKTQIGGQQDLAEVQGRIQGALQASGAAQQKELTQLQGTIQGTLQAQANDQQLTRMAAEFANQAKVQSADQENALARINASGDQDMRKFAAQAVASMNELSMNLAQKDREGIANATVTIFQQEANMRAALLSNTAIPAAERAGYEQAIATLGNPARTFIAQLYGTGQAPTAATPPIVSVAPPTPGATAGGGLNAGGALATSPLAEGPATGGLNQGGALSGGQEVPPIGGGFQGPGSIGSGESVLTSPPAYTAPAFTDPYSAPVAPAPAGPPFQVPAANDDVAQQNAAVIAALTEQRNLVRTAQQ